MELHTRTLDGLPAADTSVVPRGGRRKNEDVGTFLLLACCGDDPLNPATRTERIVVDASTTAKSTEKKEHVVRGIMAGLLDCEETVRAQTRQAPRNETTMILNSGRPSYYSSAL
jgi:hypothetical protein